MTNLSEIEYRSAEFEELKKIRIEVFVREQGVPEEEEMDKYDEEAIHFGWKHGNGKVVATCRLCLAPPLLKLGRVAVLKEYRGTNIGSRMNAAVVGQAARRWPTLLLVAQAQTTAIPFYARLGAVVVSGEFYDEVNILHHSIMFPFRELAPQYDLLWHRSEAEEGLIKGEVADPEVMENMRRVLHGIEDASYVPLSLLTSFLCSEWIGAGLVRKFIQYAAAVCDQQSRTDELQGCSQLGVSRLEDETVLLGMAWDRLNIGHYSEVDYRWRRFYFAVSLAKSVRLRNESKYQDSLHALDMGLLMGEHYLPDDYLIRYTDRLEHELPKRSINQSLPPQSDAPPAPLPQSVRVPHAGTMSEEDFLEAHLLPELPVLIKGAVRDWPAATKWSFDYLDDVMGYRLVPVEIGSKYTDDHWAQRLMSVYEFMELASSPTKTPEGPVYLAQHRLLDQIPQLKRDIRIPHYCLASGQDTQDVDMNIWLGPCGTVSPLHTDPKDNLFCQVSGRKFVRLISPTDSDNIYAMEDGILTNTSQVNVEQPDLASFPLFSAVQCWDAVVEAGDALFIPKGWWHHVRSLTPSTSVSFWFETER